MNRILLATICGIILGAIIISMASRDRFVDADSLNIDANSNSPRFATRDPSTPFSSDTSTEANTNSNARATNALAPRSGRDRIGTSRGRDRSAFDRADASSTPLIDRDALNAERTMEALRLRDQRREEREEARRRAEVLMESRRQQVLEQREQRQRQLAQIRNRTNQMMASNTSALQPTIQDGVSAEVAQAMQALADTITEQSEGSSPFSASSALSGDLIGDLVGAITAEMDNNGGSNLLALLQSLGFGDILQGGLQARDMLTLSQQGLTDLIYDNARPKTVWIPVERSRNSRLLNSTRTNDLFIVYPTPTMVTVVESPADTGIHVTGGSFVQIEGGDNGPTILDPNDLRAYDSFLTLNGQSPGFAGTEPPATDWGSEVEASWFSVPPLPGSIDPDRFGDNRTYVWIGRFTVKADDGETPVVGGRIKTSALKLLTGEVQDLRLLVEADPSIWSPLDELAPTEPRLKSFRSRSAIVESGEQITFSLDLDLPAPRVGVDVTLTSDNPAIVLPETVHVPYESIGVDVSVYTAFLFESTDVLVTASYNGNEISQLIRVTGHLRGDLNGDGYVDGADLGLMLGAHGMDNLPMADLDGDGQITSADLGLLLAQWRTPEPPPAEQNITSKWLPVPISTTCAAELADTRTADLYLAFDLEPENLRFVVASTEDHNLRIEGGEFHQNTTFGDNLIPDEGFFTLDPCLAYDTYLTVGDTEIFFGGTSLNKDDWGDRLVANWFTSEIEDTSIINVEQDPAKFGDSKFYIRIARISASLGSTYIGGKLDINDAGALYVVDIPHESSIWGDFDFNDDSIVDYLDAALLKDAVALSSTNQSFDLDGDSDVDAEDLLLFLVAFPEFE